MTEKRDIKSLIQQEETHLNNLLEPNDLKSFKGMVDELRDTWTKKQIFRTETDEYKLENYKIDLDEKIYSKASMEAVAKDRMREINMWSKLKLEFNDGTFNDKNVNEHQLDTYHQVYLNKAKTLTSGSSQPEVFNVVGQLETIERVKKSGELKYDKKEQLQYGKESK